MLVACLAATCRADCDATNTSNNQARVWSSVTAEGPVGCLHNQVISNVSVKVGSFPYSNFSITTLGTSVTGTLNNVILLVTFSDLLALQQRACAVLPNENLQVARNFVYVPFLKVSSLVMINVNFSLLGMTVPGVVNPCDARDVVGPKDIHDSLGYAQLLASKLFMRFTQNVTLANFSVAELKDVFDFAKGVLLGPPSIVIARPTLMYGEPGRLVYFNFGFRSAYLYIQPGGYLTIRNMVLMNWDLSYRMYPNTFNMLQLHIVRGYGGRVPIMQLEDVKLVIPYDQFLYFKHWFELFLSPLPADQVAVQWLKDFEWPYTFNMTEWSYSTPSAGPVVFPVFTSSKYYWYNVSMDYQAPGFVPTMAKSGIMSLHNDPYHPYLEYVAVSNAQELRIALQHRNSTSILLLQDVVVQHPNTSLDKIEFKGDCLVTALPLNVTVWDLGPAYSMLVGANVTLLTIRNLVLVPSGLSTNGTYNPQGLRTDPKRSRFFSIGLWSFEFLNPATQIRMVSVTIIVPEWEFKCMQAAFIGDNVQCPQLSLLDLGLISATYSPVSYYYNTNTSLVIYNASKVGTNITFTPTFMGTTINAWGLGDGDVHPKSLNDAQSSSNSSTTYIAIIVSMVGALVVVVALAGLFYFKSSKQKHGTGGPNQACVKLQLSSVSGDAMDGSMDEHGHACGGFGTPSSEGHGGDVLPSSCVEIKLSAINDHPTNDHGISEPQAPCEGEELGQQEVTKDLVSVVGGSTVPFNVPQKVANKEFVVINPLNDTWSRVKGVWNAQEVVLHQTHCLVSNKDVLCEINRALQRHQAMQHPNIVATLGWDIQQHTAGSVATSPIASNLHEHNVCIVQECCDLGCLDDAIGQKLLVFQEVGMLDMSRILQVALEVACGLLYLHNEKLTAHHAINMHAVLVQSCRSSPSKVTFKLRPPPISALIMTATSAENTPPAYTRRHYLAPEVMQGMLGDYASDIYSYGVLLQQLCKCQDGSVVQSLGQNQVQSLNLSGAMSPRDELMVIAISCMNLNPYVRPKIFPLVMSLIDVLRKVAGEEDVQTQM